MHVIIGTLIAIATLVFWVGRAARGTQDIADAANTIANLPRKRRYLKEARQSGYDLVNSPTEAASVLMVSVAKMGEDNRVTNDTENVIVRQLRGLGIGLSDADGLFRFAQSLTHDITLPENALFPMLDILQPALSRSEAAELADMMTTIANVGGDAHAEQTEFIRRFRERMNLL